MEKDDRGFRSLHHAGRRLGEVPVYRDVTFFPCFTCFVTEAGRVREVVDAVLHEPQEWVGDLVVHQLVGPLVVLDERYAKVLDLVRR